MIWYEDGSLGVAMKLESQFTRSGRKFKLWHLLLAVAVHGLMIALAHELWPTPVSPF